MLMSWFCEGHTMHGIITILSFPLHCEARILHWAVVFFEDLGPLRKQILCKRLATSFVVESPHTLPSLCCFLRMSLYQCKKCTGKTWLESEHERCEHGDISGKVYILFIMFSPHTFLSFLNTTWVSSEKNHSPSVCMFTMHVWLNVRLGNDWFFVCVLFCNCFFYVHILSNVFSPFTVKHPHSPKH